jgi:hypothetical protein
MVATLLRWELCTLLPGYKITKCGLPALKFSSLIIVIHPIGNLSLSSLRYNELVNLSYDSGCNWV